MTRVKYSLLAIFTIALIIIAWIFFTNNQMIFNVKNKKIFIYSGICGLGLFAVIYKKNYLYNLIFKNIDENNLSKILSKKFSKELNTMEKIKNILQTKKSLEL
jgi:hypothetical protein